jgi:hypothetical protein
MSSFPYRALDNYSHEIRILEFHNSNPYDWEEDAFFEGTLEHVSLIDTKPYNALSYCWGLETGSKFIRLCPHRDATAENFGITENLHSALLALWNRKGERKTLRIWVDALCINQKDLHERSQQVQMMRQIYSRAEEVLAWVGPTAGRVLSSTVLEHPPDIIPTSEEGWQALKFFFNEEYWRRVWIIQEITVASTVKMLYGYLEFSWNKLAPTLKLLLKHSALGRDENEIDVSGIGASHLLRFREHWIDANKPISLLQAMTWTIHTKATDPRDKIFALLGLCHDGFRLVPFPNYKQSLESIISEMSKLAFSRNRSLDLMCIRGRDTVPKRNSELPTWAPNWPNLWSSQHLAAHEKWILQSPSTFNFDPVLTNSTNFILKVEALFVGSILGISSGLGMNNGHTQTTQSLQLRKSWIFHTENLRPQIPRSYDAREYSPSHVLTIWKTLIKVGLGLGFKYNPEDIYECFSKLWTPQGRGSIYNIQIIDWIDKNSEFRIGPWTLREWSQLNPPGNDSSEFRVGSWPLREWSSVWPRSKKLDTEITGERRTVNAWDATNHALEQVLGGGCRLADLQLPPFTFFSAACLVDSHPEVSDKVFFVRGCSLPVALRQASPFDPAQPRWKVIGGVWLLSNKLGLSSYQDWADGKGEVPDGAEVQVLDLV